MPVIRYNLRKNFSVRLKEKFKMLIWIQKSPLIDLILCRLRIEELAVSILRIYWTLTYHNKIEKGNEPICVNDATDGRTDGRTKFKL